MANSIDLELDDLAAEFELLGDWEERYRYLIDLGRELAPLSPGEHTDAHKVRGCASQVWLVRDFEPGGALKFRGAVKGLIGVLLRLYSGRRPEDILDFDAKAGFATLGLQGALSTQRSNGLAAMVERIRRDAAESRARA